MLIIAATDNDTVNTQVFEAAEQHNIFVNVVDDQPKCRFIFPLSWIEIQSPLPFPVQELRRYWLADYGKS